MAKVVKPLGVYNNRGTHDGQAAFQQIPNSNVGNIIGVNISNYCFMRDIFGVDLREGDSLELWYGATDSSDGAVQITPVSGCFDDNEGNIDIANVQSIYGTKNGGTEVENLAKNYNDGSSNKVIKIPIGKVWATPIHHPFQTVSNYKNIVGWNAGRQDETQVAFALGNLATDPSLVYKNIEVELCPSQMFNCL